MKTTLAAAVAVAIATSAHGAQPDPRTLDPAKPEDRITLLGIVSGSSNGGSNRAAKRLAEAGHMDELLHLLSATTSYNTMQAIAQTHDERTIAVLEARIRREPNNRDLVGSLAYVHDPKASSILVEMLKRNPDSEDPSEQDMVGCLLNAIVHNRCQDAIPLLRERLAACGATSQANRKSNYALTLLSLGDAIGMPWLSKKLDADIETKGGHSWAADRLATICEWMPPRLDIVHIRDESIMSPLLPTLVRGASSPDCPFARECVRVLRVLTRHDFPVGDAAWQRWLQDHAIRHPIYSQPLDRATRLCTDMFRRHIARAAKADEKLRWIGHFLEQRKPHNGYGSHNDFLWKLESRPELLAAAPPSESKLPPYEEWKEFGLSFTVALTSRLVEPAQTFFRKDFDAINVTVCLASPAENEHVKKSLATIANEACRILAEYEAFYANRYDAEQEKSSVDPEPPAQP